MQKGRVAMAGNSGKWRRLIMAIAAVLYCSLGAFLVTSREGDSSGGREIQLTLTVPAGQTTDPIYRGAIDRFEAENPGVSVKLIPVSSRNYYQKVMVMVAGNCAPDLMWMGQSFNEFADKGLLLDLSRRIRQARIDLNEYKPAVLNWYRRGKRLYSLPFGEDVSFLFYNRRLFREAGVPYPTDDWSLEEFLAAARKLTRRDAEGRVLCYGFRGQLEPGVFGAAPIRISDGEVNCDTPEMRGRSDAGGDADHEHRCPQQLPAGTGGDDAGIYHEHLSGSRNLPGDGVRHDAAAEGEMLLAMGVEPRHLYQ